MDLVYYCVVARLTQSLVLGNYYYSIYKDPYLLITAKTGWQTLALLLSYTPDKALSMWLNEKDN